MPKTARHTRLATGLALSFLLSSTALTQEPATLSVDRDGTRARILIDYADDVGDRRPDAEVDIQHTVLIATFSEPVSADVRDLASQLGSLAARARLDDDGRTLRVALNQEADAHVSSSYDWLAIDLVPPGAPAPRAVVSPRELAEVEAAARAEEEAGRAPEGPPPVPAMPVDLRIGQNSEYTRLELIWPETVDYALRQNGNIAELRFARPAEVSLARLAGSPPALLRNAQGRREGDEWVLQLELEEGVRARAWGEGERIAIDLVSPDAASAQSLLEQIAELLPEESAEPLVQAAEAIAEAEPDPAGPAILTPTVTEPVEEALAPEPEPEIRNPIPESGIVPVAVSEFNGDLRTEFGWTGPVGAAVFRRGEAIWIVFDTLAELDMRELAFRQSRHASAHTVYSGEDYVAVRMVVPSTTQAEVRQDGDEWTVVFSERIDSPPRPINVRRDARRGRLGRILVDMSSPREVRWIDDPMVGDRIAAVTAGGPVEGLATRRTFVGGALLPSAQGIAVQAVADDVAVSIIGGGAVVGRPEGLNLTPSSDGARSQGDASVLANISSPALMDFDNWRGNGYFADEWRARTRSAAVQNSPDSRVSLARFLLAHDLAPEALGMLNLATRDEPDLANDSHVRALRGVASYMMHRLDDAQTYLSTPSLAMDPAADMWRGMIAVEQERWEDARRRLGRGEDAAFFYPPVWQARYQAALARATLELGDFASAEQHLYAIENGEPDEQTRLDGQYISARLAEANGDLDTAITRLEELAVSGNPPMEARAIYEMTRLKLADGRIERDAAIEELENLRFRWRGDSIESETIRTLGQLYVESGQYGRGLETMAMAQSRFAGNESERRIFEDMNSIFRRLFLEGEADRMDPIEAVAVFYQYQHLAPIGADGDRMIRRLADRLIAFDLLDPASELLQHQVDNRLREPIARARVATDLAVVYLMDHRYEDALNTIRRSRVAGLPSQLVDERYLLEARALSEMGRVDAALDLIADDRSDAAGRLRADIAWDNRDWEETGPRIERLLGNRYQNPAPLTPPEQNDVMRAAIAYSLAGDRASARRLGQRFGEMMDATDQAAAFALLTDDNATPGNVRFNDLAGRIAGIDTLEAFIQPFRARFNGEGA